ncbi:MAG: M16 family metallopeptidase [Candidatus Cryptobacteroides sp.]
MRYRFISILLAVCALCGCNRDGRKIPVSDKVLTGKLSNGLTYYVRHNEEPKERASFYIIQNVGAILENDDQNGLAHFLEHMAFQGTDNFPDKGIIETLERHGVSFGGNINAYTAQNETVYNISSVPTTDPALIDTCLMILHDWSDYLTLSDEEIDAERGVIAEEWRTRRNPGFRIGLQINPVIYKGSQYAKRDVIGDIDVIRTFDPKTLRDFYHDWYRTDLQAIAVVGDVDAEETVEKIKTMFGPIPAVENPKERTEFEIPAHKEMYYVLGTDKESTSSSVQIMTIIPNRKDNKDRFSYLREGLVANFFNTMISNRLAEIMQQSNPPYLGGSIGFGGLVRNYAGYYCTATAKPNEETEALKTILTENERVRRYGFSDSELERAKANLLAAMESSYKQRDKFGNESFVSDIKSNFLTGEPLIEYEDYYKYVRKTIPKITVEEIMEYAKPWFTNRNKVAVITGPDDVTHLTEDEVRGIINYVEGDTSILPFEDEFIGQDLVQEAELKGSRIEKVVPVEMFDAEEWILENGVKVVYRKADYEKDNVTLYAYSEGGTSLYGVKDLPNAENAAAFTNAYGAGEFNAIALSKALAGKMVSCQAAIGENNETVTASSTPQDLETMFKLLYLRFTAPRMDEEEFQSILNRNLASVDDICRNPNKIIQDSINFITTSYSPRTQPLSRKYLERLNMKRMNEIYRERFANAADFTFFIVGNVEAEQLKPLVEKYIGSIPASDDREEWVDNMVRAPKGVVKKVIPIRMETPKSLVVTSFRKEMPYNLHDMYCNNVLKGILDVRYTENIREKEGGTYGVSVNSEASKEPVEVYNMTMTFNCDPDRAGHLKSLIYAEIEKIKKEGVTQDEISAVTRKLLKDFEQSKTHNGYWLSVITTYYIYDINNNDPAQFEDILKNMTPEDISDFVSRMFDNPEIIDVVFEPEE